METLLELERRKAAAENLEKDFIMFAEKSMQFSEKVFSQFNEKLGGMEVSIEKMKHDLEIMQADFKLIVKQLRATVSKGDIDVLQRKMQKFKPESLVRVSDFRKMLGNEF